MIDIFYRNILLGMARILLGKGPAKETAFLDVTPIHLEVCFAHRFYFIPVVHMHNIFTLT